MVLEPRSDEMNYINHYNSLSPGGGRELERGGNSPSPRPSPCEGEGFMRDYAEDFRRN
jgi:hypothetical protein